MCSSDLFGGFNRYTGRDMRTAHARLVTQGLNDGHFDAVIENLAATLRELGVGGYLKHLTAGESAKTMAIVGRQVPARREAYDDPKVTKDEIIAMYLNQFNYINNAYGIHAAAEVYFGKDQKLLKTEECATLVGMLQNPAFFSPVRHPERCIRRRWIVLSQMKKTASCPPPSLIP